MFSKILEHNKIFLAVIACVILLLCAFETTRTYVAAADEVTTAPSGSFADLARAGCDFLNQYAGGVVKAYVQEEESKASPPIPRVAGKAGGLLGYSDSPIVPDSGVVTSVYNINTRGEGVYNYEAMSQGLITYISTKNDKGEPVEEKEPDGKQFLNYCYYGCALNKIGFDQTGFNSFDASTRQIMGVFLIALYLLTAFLGDFWDLVIGILNLANPLYLFSNGTGNAGSAFAAYKGAAMGRVKGDIASSISDGMESLKGLIGDLYTTIQNIGVYLVIPLGVALALFIVLVVNKGKGFGKTFKNVLIRVAFVTIGVPLMITFYGTFMSTVSTVYDEGQTIANKAILSTFVDFEAWAKSGLDVKPIEGDYKIVYNKDTNSVPREQLYKARLGAYAINREFGGFDDTPKESVAAIDNKTGLYNFDKDIMNEFMTKKDIQTKVQASGRILELLERYARGDKFTSGAYENYAKEGLDPTLFAQFCSLSDAWQEYDSTRVVQYEILNGGSVYGFANTLVKEVLSHPKISWDLSTICNSRFSTPYTDEELEEQAEEVRKIGHRLSVFVRIMSHTKANVFGNGALRGNGGSVITFTQNGGGRYERCHALSTMSMYNYLSSVFEDEQVTVFSANNTSNRASKAEHFSVNLIGTEYVSVIYYFDLVVLFCSFVVIGYGYGFALILANFRSVLKMVPAIISGTMGIMRGIASSLLLIFCMAAEVGITCILYNLAFGIVSGIHTIINAPLARLISELINEKMDPTGLLFLTITGVMSICTLVYLTSKMLTYRHATVQMVSEWFANGINKFMGTSVGAPDLSKAPHMSAGMLGSAALVGANKLNSLGNNYKGDGTTLSERLGLFGRGSKSSLADSSDDPELENNLDENGLLGDSNGESTASVGNGSAVTNKSEAELAAARGAADSGKSDADIVAENQNFVAADGSSAAASGAGAGGGINLDKNASKHTNKHKNVKTIVSEDAEGGSISSEDNFVSDYDSDYSAGESDYAGMTDESNAFNGQSAADAISSEGQSISVTGEDGEEYSISAHTDADGTVSYDVKSLAADGSTVAGNISADNIRMDSSGNIVVGTEAGETTYSINGENNAIAVATIAGAMTGGALSAGNVNITSPVSMSGVVNTTVTRAGGVGGTVIASAGAVSASAAPSSMPLPMAPGNIPNVAGGASNVSVAAGPTNGGYVIAAGSSGAGRAGSVSASASAPRAAMPTTTSTAGNASAATGNVDTTSRQTTTVHSTETVRVTSVGAGSGSAVVTEGFVANASSQVGGSMIDSRVVEKVAVKSDGSPSETSVVGNKAETVHTTATKNIDLNNPTKSAIMNKGKPETKDADDESDESGESKVDKIVSKINNIVDKLQDK